MVSPSAVARYYDRNTRRFLLVGGRGSHAIHRQLWGPDVRTAREAEEYVDGLLVQEIAALSSSPAPTILDMGCGVGGTLFRLARAFPESRLHGVTISGRQHDIAQRLATTAGFPDRCTLTHDDFEAVELGVRADVIVAVESFVHASSPAAFFESAARHLAADGHVIVIDDFLAQKRSELGDVEREWVGRFEQGWRLSSLSTASACAEAGAGVGMESVEDRDLTSLTRQGRPRDRAITLLSPVFEALGLAGAPFFANMIGGNALQIGLRRGFLEYRMLAFRRTTRD